MKTTRDAYELILRGMGWQRYVAGAVDSGQSSGWMPPGEPGSEQQVDIRPGATLPEGSWSAEKAMQLVFMEAFATCPDLRLELHWEGEGDSLMVMTVLGEGGESYRQVPDEVQPTHFQALWREWADEVRDAMGTRRSDEEAQAMIDGLVAAHQGTQDADEVERAPVPELPPVYEAQRGDVPLEVLNRPTFQEGLSILQANMENAQLILDEGGRGARRRALQALGFRT